MPFIKDFVNLVFYGNFWIAICATSMALQTQLLYQGSVQITPLIALIFFATLLVYALHRIVGINRLKDFLDQERYRVIYHYRTHIRIYAILGGLGALFFYFFLPRQIQLELFLPGLVSLAYVWPVLTGKRRLRDIDHIKIFLISVVYAWVTVRLPAIEAGHSWLNLSQLLQLAERSLFIFAITLPFDIRDLMVDRQTHVKTIPAIIGIPRTKQLAYATLALAFFLSVLNFEFYTLSGLIGLGISYGRTAWFVSLSDTQKHDYIFTGLMDGTMIIQFLLVAGMLWLAQFS